MFKRLIKKIKGWWSWKHLRRDLSYPYSESRYSNTHSFWDINYEIEEDQK